MSEYVPTHEGVPITREMVVDALRNWTLEALELLRQYYDALTEHYGDTKEGRYTVGEEMISVYMESGHYDEALDTVNAMLATADGERDYDTYNKFFSIGEKVSKFIPNETPRTMN